MKPTVAVLSCIVASAAAFSPLMATRAVGNPFKKAVKKAPPAKKALPAKKAPAAKKGGMVNPFAKKAPVKKAPPAPVKAARGAPPQSAGYPSYADKAQAFSLGNISGGGNNAPPVWWTVPDFSNPALQIDRDPDFYAAAAATRNSKASKEYVIDDGLTVLERRQKGTAMSTFLTGSARGDIDKSAITEIDGEEFLFGLTADRFQLLFIAVFGLFTLVGSLSGNLNL